MKKAFQRSWHREEYNLSELRVKTKNWARPAKRKGDKVMKKMKKIFAMLLSLAMVMGMSMTSFAADNIIGNSDDRGRVTVLGAETGLSVTAYPIAMAEYDSVTGNFSGYSNPYNLKDIEKPTQEELAAIAASNPQGGYALAETTDADKNVIYTRVNAYGVPIDDLPVGMYLIGITGSDTTVYNVAVASINYKNVDNENVINGGTVTMVTSGAAWVKKSDVPTVDKTAEDVKGNAVNIGDSVDYKVTINPIPNYNGNYPKLNVVDTLSDGLTYNKDLTVKIGDKTLVADTDYKLTVNGQVITVNFVVDGKYMLNDYTGQEVVIAYSATLNEKAKLNEVGNGNDVVLNYSKDSKTDGNDDTDESKTYTYTFEIDGAITGQQTTEGIITKVGEIGGATTNPEPLSGATFTLYTDEACTTMYTNNVFTGTATSDANGQLKMTGLATGTYYLKETAAPEGYSINTHVFKVEIGATYYEEADLTEGMTKLDIGKLKTWSVEIDDVETAHFEVNNQGKVTNDKPIVGVDIPNTKLSELPSTGGIGTTIFTIGGCLIMIIAAALFFASRKKSSK